MWATQRSVNDATVARCCLTLAGVDLDRSVDRHLLPATDSASALPSGSASDPRATTLTRNNLRAIHRGNQTAQPEMLTIFRHSKASNR